MAVVNDEIRQLPKVAKCRRCNRVLTDHESILFELGPVCRVKEGMNLPKVRVRKLDVKIKKPRVHTLKFSKPDSIFPGFNLEEWFSEGEK